jgi:hypothetical protein
MFMNILERSSLRLSSSNSSSFSWIIIKISSFYSLLKLLSNIVLLRCLKLSSLFTYYAELHLSYWITSGGLSGNYLSKFYFKLALLILMNFINGMLSMSLSSIQTTYPPNRYDNFLFGFCLLKGFMILSSSSIEDNLTLSKS